jgi:hypothetical protein
LSGNVQGYSFSVGVRRRTDGIPVILAFPFSRVKGTAVAEMRGLAPTNGIIRRHSSVS